MGILGNLLGGLANAAFEGIQQGFQESKLESCNKFGILFERESHISGAVIPEIQNNMIQTILTDVASIFGVKITNSNLAEKWYYHVDRDCVDGEVWDAFIFTTGAYTIKFGLYGMAYCALSMEGFSCGQFAPVIKEYLEGIEFEHFALTNIRYHFDTIPFHLTNWFNEMEESLSEHEEYDDSEENELEIIDGDPENAVKILKKLDDVFQRELDALFDKDNLIFTITDNEEGIKLPTLKDNNIAIEFFVDDEYLSSEELFPEGNIFLNYIKDSKSLALSYVKENGISTILTAFQKADGSILSYEAQLNNCECGIASILEAMEENDIDIPENFSNHLHDFILSLVEEVRKLNSKNNSDSDLDDM